MLSDWGALAAVKCLEDLSRYFSQCFLRAVWLQRRESPVAISSANREDVSRFPLFPSTVAAEGAGMSILVPVVMQAKDDAWSPVLLIPRTSGPKDAQGRCEGPLLADYAQTEHIKGARRVSSGFCFSGRRWA